MNIDINKIDRFLSQNRFIKGFIITFIIMFTITLGAQIAGDMVTIKNLVAAILVISGISTLLGIATKYN